MRGVGFDFTAGRLDDSAHPFCGGTPDDVRLTTMYLPHDFTMALLATMHETGHAMYAVGWFISPTGGATSRSMATAAKPCVSG